MRAQLHLLCALAVFVLINDRQRVVSAARAKRAVDKYTTRYDNIDIDRIVASRRLLLNYVNCLLDKGPCTAEGKELKTYLPEALQTECAKCSEVQKKQAGKVLSHLLQYHRDFWDALIAKYDPDGNFRKKYGVDDDEDYKDGED